MSEMPRGVQTWFESGYFAPLLGPREPRLFIASHGDKKTTREAVFLLPDTSASSFVFNGIAPALASKGLRAVSFDYPGQGFSKASDTFVNNRNGRVEIIRTVVRSLGLDHIHVVMHGTGCLDGVEAFSTPSTTDVRSFTCLGPVMGESNSPAASPSGKLLCKLHQLPVPGKTMASILAVVLGWELSGRDHCVMPCSPISKTWSLCNAAGVDNILSPLWQMIGYFC